MEGCGEVCKQPFHSYSGAYKEVLQINSNEPNSIILGVDP